MTDKEEKARAKRLAKKFINRKEIWKTYDSCICNLIEDVYIRAYKQALHDKKDGLSEGKPKWHDLRKDPNDLPQIDGDYLCRIYLYGSDNTFPGVLYYDPSCKGFVLEEGGEPFEVKAWCELLEFKEE